MSSVILISNLVILIAGSVIVMILQDQRLGVVVYSLIYILTGSSVMGMLKRGFNHPQKFLIVTTKYEELSQEILTSFKRGLSYMKVENTREDGEERKLIMVCRSIQAGSSFKTNNQKVRPQSVYYS